MATADHLVESCQLAAVKVLLLRRGLLDRADEVMNSPEWIIRWTTGGSIQVGGPMAEQIRQQVLGLSIADMAVFIAEAASLQL